MDPCVASRTMDKPMVDYQAQNVLFQEESPATSIFPAPGRTKSGASDEAGEQMVPDPEVHQVDEDGMYITPINVIISDVRGLVKVNGDSLDLQPNQQEIFWLQTFFCA